MAKKIYRYGFHYADSTSRPKPLSAQFWNAKIEEPFLRECRHECWVMDCLLSGTGTGYKVDELAWQERLVGSIHIYPAKKRYFERGTGGDLSGAFFLFSGQDSCLQQLVNNPAGFAEIIDKDRLLCGCIQKGAQAASRSNRGYWQFCSRFAEAMELLEHLVPDDKRKWQYHLFATGSRELPLAEKILDFLGQHYRDSLDMTQLAEYFCCSPSTLAHKFREFYGESIWERLLKIRIEQSVLLLNRGMTLKEIAAETGFSTEFYYSRIFKKLIGIAPGAYRKQQR